MDKSKLVQYLFTEAENVMTAEGGFTMTANYFIIAYFNICKCVADGIIPPALANDEDSLLELKESIAYIPITEDDYDTLISSIRRGLHTPGYLSVADEFMFRRCVFNSKPKAIAENKDEVTLDIYIKMIFDEPTEAIKNTFADVYGNKDSSSKAKKDDSKSTSKKKKADEKKGEDALEDLFNRYFFESDDKKEDDKKDSSRNSSAKKAAPKTQKQRLSDTVGTTANIQKTLLESIYGQDKAVTTFVSGYFRSEINRHSGKGIGKPKATFLFAGPPGVGKTFLAEQAAEALKLPYCRFDMSEYADKEANYEFAGSDKVYKNGKVGNVTSFVAENPKCVLLFDEIEKSHLVIIHLFLQILDAGRIRDNFTDEEVDFSEAVIIFTTNVGKNLYEDSTYTNLSNIPRKKILHALGTDKNVLTGAPLFPAAICSRFASGNIVMFNHLGANNLLTIARRELDSSVKGFKKATGLDIEIEDRVPVALLLAEGGKADARTVKGRSGAFIHDELYELFRLISNDDKAVENLEKIKVDVNMSGVSDEIVAMFDNKETPEILVFADDKLSAKCKSSLSGIICHTASNLADAREILFNHDITLILTDVTVGARSEDDSILNVEDLDSVGMDFLSYALDTYSIPVHLLEEKKGTVSEEEFISFAGLGVADIVSLNTPDEGGFDAKIKLLSDIAYRQQSLFRLARENKVLSYKTSQSLSRAGKVAKISICNLKLSLSTDIEDSQNIVSSVSKPNNKFEDVIGAENAKDELKYFVQYLKNPVKYLRQGVKAPKGILLYGPPGTGKTLLAKAMAGESDVTFIAAEGNSFKKPVHGESAAAVHSLFASARKYAPSIIFIDEIDAVGKDRSSSGEAEGDILTAFLTEMDGFKTDTTKPIFVLAATNYQIDSSKGKALDPALLRRFDRRIYVDLPNREERQKFIKMKDDKYHQIKLSDEQIENIAVRSTGMSLAELDSVFEMALRNAIRSSDGKVGDEAFEEAFETFNGGEKVEWNPDLLTRTARHEAGHALMCWLYGEKPSYLTVVARADHGGYMQHGDTEGKYLFTRSELLSRIRISLAGRAAEIVYYGMDEGLSTGPSADLSNATRTAENMITKYGMDPELGMSYIYMDGASDSIRAEVRRRVNAILSEELNKAIEVIKENTDAIDAMVTALVNKNYLKENEIDGIISTNIKKKS